MAFNYVQTIIFTTIGGILGVLFFYFLSNIIIGLYRRYLAVYFRFFFLKNQKKKKKSIAPVVIKIKKNLQEKNRFIILLKGKVGMIGIAILTPTVLSIPLGTFLASKYYSKAKKQF